ncbi:hypothetical protein [Spirosoma liriopis]|nr:hypothetical protein [Spirosoma liriopis]
MSVVVSAGPPARFSKPTLGVSNLCRFLKTDITRAAQSPQL